MRGFSRMHPKSIGCESLGNSGMVSDGSRGTVKCSATVPRVCCNVGLKFRCGNFKMSTLFRKMKRCDIVLGATDIC